MAEQTELTYGEVLEARKKAEAGAKEKSNG